ncbi:hypothetical protein GCWU000324_03165 [Kingella oralis ATCC 51147]|uniref:Uncharacterized protein n=1 Tax=Kingella oralis ATCC 51147 TaxID=629741 RepID=C4GN76_9NEIS|nr:hypothetical protein GCWU000324_03165 [Kingella oralis ATCC 51147]
MCFVRTGFQAALCSIKRFQAASGLTRLRQSENQNETTTVCRQAACSIRLYRLAKYRRAINTL